MIVHYIAGSSGNVVINGEVEPYC